MVGNQFTDPVELKKVASPYFRSIPGASHRHPKDPVIHQSGLFEALDSVNTEKGF